MTIKIDDLERGTPASLACELAHVAGAMRSNGNERSASVVDQAKNAVEQMRTELDASHVLTQSLVESLKRLTSERDMWHDCYKEAARLVAEFEQRVTPKIDKILGHVAEAKAELTAANARADLWRGRCKEAQVWLDRAMNGPAIEGGDDEWMQVRDAGKDE